MLSGDIQYILQTDDESRQGFSALSGGNKNKICLPPDVGGEKNKN